LGGMLMHQDVATPTVVKEVHSRRWWMYLVLLVVLSGFDIVGADIFGAIFDGCIALIVWYMVRNECAQMSQYCLLLFGMMCLIQTVFGLVALISSLGGRRSEHTSAFPISQNKVSYTTVVETHPFFDHTLGPKYNIQSAVKIATPVVMLVGTTLAYLTYSCFPSSMFYDEGDNMGGPPAEPLGGRFGGGGFGGNGNLGNAGNYGGVRTFEGRGQSLGGGGGNGNASPNAGNSGRPTNRGQGLFEGSGQRLGSG